MFHSYFLLLCSCFLLLCYCFLLLCYYFLLLLSCFLLLLVMGMGLHTCVGSQVWAQVGIFSPAKNLHLWLQVCRFDCGPWELWNELSQAKLQCAWDQLHLWSITLLVISNANEAEVLHLLRYAYFIHLTGPTSDWTWSHRILEMKTAVTSAATKIECQRWDRWQTLPWPNLIGWRRYSLVMIHESLRRDMLSY